MYHKYRPPNYCNYPFTNHSFGYCWSWANHIDGDKKFYNIESICKTCEFNTIMETKFIKFLIKNNAYRQFMHNLAYVRKGNMCWNEYRDTTEEKDWLICAFEFDQSKEGHDFWFDLALKWHKLLN